MHNFGVDGNTKIVVMEAGNVRTFKARTLFHRLLGKKASHFSMDEVCGINNTRDISIQCQEGDKVVFNRIVWAFCSRRAVCKLKGDRISISASYDTFLYDKENGWTDLEHIYPKTNMVKYLNLKNEYVFDWVTGVSMPQSDFRFVYGFYTDCGNFIADRLVVQSAI